MRLFKVFGPMRKVPTTNIPVNMSNFSDRVLKQEEQVALNRAPEFCLKLTYRYLLNGDTWDAINFWPQGHNLNKLGRGLLGHATYQISKL